MDEGDRLVLLFFLLSDAKVAHLDARPVNIIWRATSENTLEMRLIDFEYAVAFDIVVSNEYIRHIVNLNDKQYQFTVVDADCMIALYLRRRSIISFFILLLLAGLKTANFYWLHRY